MSKLNLCKTEKTDKEIKCKSSNVRHNVTEFDNMKRKIIKPTYPIIPAPTHVLTKATQTKILYKEEPSIIQTSVSI